MIRKIDSQAIDFPLAKTSSPKIASLKSTRYASSISSIKALPGQIFMRILRVIFSPLICIWQCMSKKIGLTTQELEIFEDLLENTIKGGAEFILNRSSGEKRLIEVAAACDDLYRRLNKKWFPNLHGILRIRLNLIKIKIRVHGILSQKEKVEESKQILQSLGCKDLEGIEEQTDILLEVSKTHYRPFIWCANCFGKIGLGFVLLINKLRNLVR